MEEVSVSVGAGRIKSNATGYKQLIGFYLSCSVHEDCVVSLDFTSVQWLDGNMCALFMAIIHKLNREKKLSFSIDRKNYSHIKKHMDLLFSNGFLTDYVKIPYSNSAVVLTAFGIDEDQKFLNYISHDLLEHRDLKILPEKRAGIEDNFLEVFSNVQLHAATTEPIFACGQYFPAAGSLHFTLVDLGQGYLPEIERFTKGAVNTAEGAIKWAIEEGNTTKKDAPGGTGLKNLLKFCNETNGLLSIITGDSYWSNNNTVTAVPVFCGTTIQMIFNCKN